MDSSIFRKNSLETLSSPEQLNDYLKVTNPKIWVVLLGLSAILAAVGFWTFRGSIPETVVLNGLAFAQEGPVQKVYGYAHLRTAQRLQVGMTAQVSPDFAPRDQYGYIYGKVVQVGERPRSEAQLAERFGEADYIKDFLPKEGKAVEIVVQLDPAKDGLHWSNRRGETIQVPSGSECAILIIIQERKPYQLILGR